MPDLDATKIRLLDAAGEIFADKGFHAATVREICGRVGANVAAVNYYFGDKERLYIAAVQRAHCAPSEDAFPDWPPGTSPARKLREFIAGLLGHVLDDKRPAWHAQLMMRELAQPTSACVALVDAFIRPLAQRLGRIVDELVPEHTPAVDRHLIEFSVVGQILFYKVHRPVTILLVGEDEHRTYNVERLTAHITQFTLAALGLASPLNDLAHPVDMEQRS